MNIKEILTRPSPSQYSIEECCYVVEQYIFQEKKISVKINIYKDLNTNEFHHPVVKFLLTKQLMKLNQAFLEASEKLKYT